MKDQELILAGVDVADMMARLMNNERLAKLVAGKFLQDRSMEALQTAVAQGSWKEAEFACHTLKGITGNLSLTELFEKFQQQLALFRSGQPEKAAQMMPQLSEGYEKAVTHLTLWLREN